MIRAESIKCEGTWWFAYFLGKPIISIYLCTFLNLGVYHWANESTTIKTILQSDNRIHARHSSWVESWRVGLYEGTANAEAVGSGLWRPPGWGDDPHRAQIGEDSYHYSIHRCSVLWLTRGATHHTIKLSYRVYQQGFWKTKHRFVPNEKSCAIFKPSLLSFSNLFKTDHKMCLWGGMSFFTGLFVWK